MMTTAALYNPASGAGSWVATTGPVPPGGIKNHTATLIQTTNTQLNNHVLLVGGNNGTSTVVVGLSVRPGPERLQHAGARFQAPRASSTRR